MELKNKQWKLGEVVTLPRTSQPLRHSGQKAYEFQIESEYVCVREAIGSQRGMLVKMMGRVPEKDIKTVAGQPFCNDHQEEVNGKQVIYSYPVPTTEELKEVLQLVRDNDVLWHQLCDASMHINPNGTFWVRETGRKMLVKKKPKYYDPKVDLTEIAADAEELHRRLTIVYFTL
jgi:hypothetical protein